MSSGPLQLDVLKSRLVAEYGLDADLEASPYDTARWISASPGDTEKFIAANRGQMAEDRDGAPVFLAKSSWELGYHRRQIPRREIRKDSRTQRRTGRLSSPRRTAPSHIWQYEQIHAGKEKQRERG
ncbi:MAG: hypothetical protein WDM89_20480 [Rhizomicrobium sp.]